MNNIKSNELCTKYGVTMQTIYLWIKAGMPYERLSSGQYRFDIEAVEEWHKKRREE
jgi:predicted site-specific integrase-resolvase